MKDKTKNILAIIIITNALIFIYFIYIRNNPNSQKVISREYPDITKILQNGEKLENLRIIDRYNNMFDINDYKDEPILFLFLKLNNIGIIQYNDSLVNKLYNYVQKGLNIFYISLDVSRIDTYKKMNNKIKIFYETSDLKFYNSFRTTKCCGSAILIDKDHFVRLSTIVTINYNIIEQIIKNKAKYLY